MLTGHRNCAPTALAFPHPTPCLRGLTAPSQEGQAGLNLSVPKGDVSSSLGTKPPPPSLWPREKLEPPAAHTSHPSRERALGSGSVWPLLLLPGGDFLPVIYPRAWRLLPGWCCVPCSSIPLLSPCFLWASPCSNISLFPPSSGLHPAPCSPTPSLSPLTDAGVTAGVCSARCANPPCWPLPLLRGSVWLHWGGKGMWGSG